MLLNIQSYKTCFGLSTCGFSIILYFWIDIGYLRYSKRPVSVCAFVIYLGTKINYTLAIVITVIRKLFHGNDLVKCLVITIFFPAYSSSSSNSSNILLKHIGAYNNNNKEQKLVILYLRTLKTIV